MVTLYRKATQYGLAGRIAFFLNAILDTVWTHSKRTLVVRAKWLRPIVTGLSLLTGGFCVGIK